MTTVATTRIKGFHIPTLNNDMFSLLENGDIFPSESPLFFHDFNIVDNHDGTGSLEVYLLPESVEYTNGQLKTRIYDADGDGECYLVCSSGYEYGLDDLLALDLENDYFTQFVYSVMDDASDYDKHIILRHAANAERCFILKHIESFAEKHQLTEIE